MSNTEQTVANMHSAEPLRLTLIAALTRSNGLGVNGTLPWRLPKEMAHFRKATSSLRDQSQTQAGGSSTDGKGRSVERKNAVVMGRKTWESIPPKFRPLKDRINVVISRTGGQEAQKALEISADEDAHLVTSLEEAVDLLRSSQARLCRTFLIGGAQLYAQVMKPLPLPHKQSKCWLLDTLLVTRIFEPAFEECDVFLPEFRTHDQIEQDSQQGKGERIDMQPSDDHHPAPMWRRASSEEFDAFLGQPVEHDVVEEKGVRYSLQMWKRSGQ